MGKLKVGSPYWYRLREIAKEEAVGVLEAVNVIRPIRTGPVCMEGLEAWAFVIDDASRWAGYIRVDRVVRCLAEAARAYAKEGK